MKKNTAWDKFVLTGKIEDYLVYKQTLNVGDWSNNADKNRWNSDKTTENQ